MESGNSSLETAANVTVARLGRGTFCIVLLVLTFLFCTRSYSQSIVVYSATQGNVSNNGYVYINPGSTYDWPMPYLEIYFTGLSSCDTVSLSIAMAWNDPYTTYETQFSTSTKTMQGTDYWLLDGSSWGTYFGSDNHSEGGYATIRYQIDGGTTKYFYFNIGGLNPSKTVVDNFDNSLAPPVAPTPPWFWGNILTWESQGQNWGARQNYVNSCPVPDSIYVKDCPLLIGNPDGIGISQVDGHSNPGYVSDSLYWNFKSNIETGLVILSGNQTTAYQFWTNQVNASSGTPVPTGDDASCHGSYFSYPQTGSWGFKDAEWIQTYNGAWPHGYFIQWNEAGYPNQWHVNYPYTYNGVTYDYVHKVCSTSSY